MSIYRRLHFPLRLFVAASLVLPAVAVATPSPARACSGPGPLLPAERFAPSTSSDAVVWSGGIALLGSVVQETTIPTQYRNVYASNVQVVVPFAGTMPSTVRVGPHGYGGADCSGGPRLLPGEKVMLFLSPSRPYIGTTPAYPGEQGNWQSGQFGTPILFDGDDAYYLSWGRFSGQGNGPTEEQRFYVGKSADVLRLVMQYFNPTPAEQEAAYRFVLGTSAPSIIPQGASRIVPPAAGDAGLATAR